jgi:hypothetical protein
MGRRLRESMVRGRRKKVDDVLTTLKRHCESDCVLEGGGFCQNLQGCSWSVYFVWKVRILICGGIERVGASVVKGQQSRQTFKVTCVYTSPRVWHVKYQSDTEARVALG